MAFGAHLPEDVLRLILFNLPVRSLIRLGCTSKEWNSVISDPKFAINHFKLASQRKTLTQRILLSTDSQVKSLDVLTSTFGEDSSMLNIIYPFKPPGTSIIILGSCNGMVFVSLVQQAVFYIWNPSTAKFIRLPDPNFEVGSLFDITVGFGYVSAADEYKAFVCSYGLSGPHIFSFRTNSWRKVGCHYDSVCLHWITKGALSNESLHWIEFLDDEDIYCEKQIIAFDLAKEEFGEIALPYVDLGRDNVTPNEFFILDLEGCLCVSVCIDSGPKNFHFWVMKEYGISETWTKLFQVDIGNDRYLVERSIFHTERSMLVCRYDETHDEGIRFDIVLLQKDVMGISGRYMIEPGDCSMMRYEETLLWLNDHLG